MTSGVCEYAINLSLGPDGPIVNLKSKSCSKPKTVNVQGGKNLEFCEKCGALMLPKREQGKKPKLVCRECGHEKRASSDPDYKVEYRIKHSPREKIVVVEGENKPFDDLSEDEKRERRKEILEYYESED